MSLNPISKYFLEGSNKHTKIRRNARAKCSMAGKLKKCEKCGYDKHVEVCHIKQISSFSEDTDISIVNDFSNILILCPNCHWEHDNANVTNKRICPKCKNPKNEQSKTCKKCRNYSNNRKVKRPSREKLQNLIEEMPMTKIGKIFGVSGVCVKKWCRYYQIKTSKKRGYWITVKNK